VGGVLLYDDNEGSEVRPSMAYVVQVSYSHGNTDHIHSVYSAPSILLDTTFRMTLSLGL